MKGLVLPLPKGIRMIRDDFIEESATDTICVYVFEPVLLPPFVNWDAEDDAPTYTINIETRGFRTFFSCALKDTHPTEDNDEVTPR